MAAISQWLRSDWLSHHPKFVPSGSTNVTVQSSDGVYFSLHRMNLETHTEAFQAPNTSGLVIPEDVIKLTEKSDVLAILFEFMYPRRQPDIERMEFEIVSQVAEAVEKYQVFSAMKVCEMRLKELVPTHAAEILAHGIKHDYPLLVNEALAYLARRPLSKTLERLPVQYHLDFCRYHEAWDKVFRDAMQKTAQKVKDYNRLSAEGLIRILQWEAIDNVVDLRRELEKHAGKCENCHNFSGFVSREAAEICLSCIGDMEPFSAF